MIDKQAIEREVLGNMALECCIDIYNQHSEASMSLVQSMTLHKAYYIGKKLHIADKVLDAEENNTNYLQNRGK